MQVGVLFGIHHLSLAFFPHLPAPVNSSPVPMTSLHHMHRLNIIFDCQGLERWCHWWFHQVGVKLMCHGESHCIFDLEDVQPCIWWAEGQITCNMPALSWGPYHAMRCFTSVVSLLFASEDMSANIANLTTVFQSFAYTFWGLFTPMDTKCQAGTTVVKRMTMPGLILLFWGWCQGSIIGEILELYDHQVSLELRHLQLLAECSSRQ